MIAVWAFLSPQFPQHMLLLILNEEISSFLAPWVKLLQIAIITYTSEYLLMQFFSTVFLFLLFCAAARDESLLYCTIIV